MNKLRLGGVYSTMALFDHSIPNQQKEELTLSVIGDAYDVWELVKMPPVRSGNLIIHEMQVGDLAFNASNGDLWHGNIEIRKKGIEIQLRNGDNAFTWCIPFYQLSIFQSEHLTIHANGYFIRLKDGYTLRQQFFIQLLEMKNAYLGRR